MPRDADYAIGSAMASTPAWLPMLDHALQTGVAAGGFVLVLLRIFKTVRDMRQAKEQNNAEAR